MCVCVCEWVAPVLGGDGGVAVADDLEDERVEVGPVEGAPARIKINNIF